MFFIDSDFRVFGLRSELIVNQNRAQLYNSNLRIVLNFSRVRVLIIRCNRNYTEFSQLKRMAASLYFQWLSGIGENQAIENYTELNNYTFKPCFYAVLNLKLRIIINLAPLGQVPEGTGGGGGRFCTLGIKRHFSVGSSCLLNHDLQNFFENKKASFLLVTSLLGRFSC